MTFSGHDDSTINVVLVLLLLLLLYDHSTTYDGKLTRCFFTGEVELQSNGRRIEIESYSCNHVFREKGHEF